MLNRFPAPGPSLPRGCGHWILVTALLAAALGLTIAAPPAPRLVWNASSSAPVGLYWVRPRARFWRGAMVVARLPEPWRRFAAERRYLPANVPLVKRVAALAGDRVCAHDNVLSINGKAVATRLRTDGAGRAMPWWQGCETLGKGQVLLLTEGAPGSFDGRYFGPVGRDDVIGRARLLWRR